MKKIIMFNLLLIFMISACQKSNDLDVIQDVIPNETKYNVSISDINKYIDAKYLSTKLSNNVSIDVIADDGDSLIFIINHNDGWELISGDKRLDPYLAYGSGYFDINDVNPSKATWLSMEAQSIKDLKIISSTKNNINNEAYRINKFWELLESPSSSSKVEGDPLGEEKYWELISITKSDYGGYSETSGHLTNTLWGQRSPWNAVAPYEGDTICVAGCTNVAGAQMLKYLHDNIGKPSGFYTSGACYGQNYNYSFTFSGYNSDAWDNMAEFLGDNKSTYQSALLIGWVGMMTEGDYGKDATSADSDKLVDIYNDLGIGCVKVDYNSSQAISSIKNGMPIIISGYADRIYVLGVIVGYDGGHCWIIDGYKTNHFNYEYKYEWVCNEPNYSSDYGHENGDTKIEYVEEEDTYIMMNWGWGGSYNNEYYKPISDWIAGEYNVKYRKTMIYNFN